MAPFFPPDSCEELAALQLAAPPPPSWYPAVLGVAFFTAFCIITVASVVGWYLLRDEPRLARGRSFAVCLFTALGLSFSQLSNVLRWALFSWDTNASVMPCWLVAFSLLGGVAVLAVAACLRMYMYYSWTLYSSLVKKTAAPKNHDDDTESVGSATTLGLHSVTSSHASIRALLAGLRSILRGPETGENEKEQMRIIQTVGRGMSGRTVFLLGFLFMLPQIIIIVVFFAAVPAYQTCTGCVWYAPLIITAIVQAGLPFGFILYLMLLTYKAPSDMYGIKTELYTWASIVPTAYLVLLLVDLFDPHDMQANNQMSWDSLCLISTVLQYLLWHVWPVALALRDRLQRQKLLDSHLEKGRSASFNSLLNGLIGALDDPAFEQLCERMYCPELLRFVQETKNFSNFYFSRSETWRKAKVRSIVDRFIRAGSPLQVNISHDLRTQIEENSLRFEQGSLDQAHGQALFASAEREIMRLLLLDVFQHYTRAQNKAKGSVSVTVATAAID